MGDTWESRAELSGREGLALLFLVQEARRAADAEEEEEDARLKSNNPKQMVGEQNELKRVFHVYCAHGI